MNSPLLAIENLTYRYGASSQASRVLDSISITLKAGELLGLLGPSGCGKTTLLRLIAGFADPEHGSITFNGELISSKYYKKAPERRRIGMVFQDYALFPHMNVLDNILFGVKGTESISRADWLLKTLSIDELRNQYPHQLSGGQRQRVALARALAPNPPLLLLDEPFCSLDVEVRHRLRSELISVLKSCDASGILVTHDPQEALAICDRVAVIKSGVLHQCAEPAELLSKPSTPFVGRFLSQYNLIKLPESKNRFTSSLGQIIVNQSLLNNKIETLMLDHTSLELISDKKGPAIIKSREFRESYFTMFVDYNGNIFRVNQSLDSSFMIGDRCDLRFVNGKFAYLYPGCISCVLKS